MNNYSFNRKGVKAKMPRFDRTGPQGKGPKTGRGLGRCLDNKQSQTINKKNPKKLK